jgi:hypothetical protein
MLGHSGNATQHDTIKFLWAIGKLYKPTKKVDLLDIKKWFSTYKNKHISVFEITLFCSFFFYLKASVKSKEIILFLLSFFCPYFLSTFFRYIASNKRVTSAVYQNGIRVHVCPLPYCPYCLDFLSSLSYCWELSFRLGLTQSIEKPSFTLPVSL